MRGRVVPQRGIPGIAALQSGILLILLLLTASPTRAGWLFYAWDKADPCLWTHSCDVDGARVVTQGTHLTIPGRCDHAYVYWQGSNLPEITQVTMDGEEVVNANTLMFSETGKIDYSTLVVYGSTDARISDLWVECLDTFDVQPSFTYGEAAVTLAVLFLCGLQMFQGLAQVVLWLRR
jgi:hypothetical protein